MMHLGELRNNTKAQNTHHNLKINLRVLICCSMKELSLSMIINKLKLKFSKVNSMRKLKMKIVNIRFKDSYSVKNISISFRSS
mgnify:CR=1 FL=1